MNGTYAAQGQRNKKIQALTFHQVSPLLLGYSRPFNPNRKSRVRTELRHSEHLQPLLGVSAASGGSVAKLLSHWCFNAGQLNPGEIPFRKVLLAYDCRSTLAGATHAIYADCTHSIGRIRNSLAGSGSRLIASAPVLIFHSRRLYNVKSARNCCNGMASSCGRILGRCHDRLDLMCRQMVTHGCFEFLQQHRDTLGTTLAMADRIIDRNLARCCCHP